MKQLCYSRFVKKLAVKSPCRSAILVGGLLFLGSFLFPFLAAGEELFLMTPEEEGRRQIGLAIESKALQWRLRIPERMFSDETVLVGHDIHRVQTPVQWRQEADGFVFCRTNTDDGQGKRGFIVEYTVRLEPEVDGVNIEFTVQNKGESALRNVVGHVCLGHQSEAFRDPNYERTYIRSDGQFLSVGDTDRGEDPIRTHYLVKDMSPIKIFNNPRNKFWGGLSDAVADNGLILTRSRNGKKLVAMVFEPASELFQNSDDRNMCLHSDPNFGDLQPGSSATVKGKIILFNGDLSDFERLHLPRLEEW